MQIHEITTLSENFLKRLATDARNDAFKKATGVDWNTYKLAQTAGQSDTPAATTPAATTPAAPKTANFSGPSGYGQTTMGFKSPTAAPVATTTPAAVAQPAATTQSSTPNFTQTNKVPYQQAVVNAPVEKVPAGSNTVAATRPVTPNFTQTNKTQYQPATVNAPVAKVPATPKPTVATAPQSPEQIRKSKPAQAAQAAPV